MGKTSGKDPPQDKETWWWNNEVREKVKENMEAKKTYDRMGNEEAKRAYREAIKGAKRAVAQAKARAREDMYDKLETREGEKRIFALAREKEKSTKNFTHIKQVKNKEGRVLVDDN